MLSESGTHASESFPASETGAAELLQALEQDIRCLLRERAEAHQCLAEAERRQSQETREMLLGVVEAMDAFDRVFQSIARKPDLVTPQMKIWLGNFRTIRRLLHRLLEERGVVRIEAPDQTFDPHWHQAGELRSDPSLPDGTIVEELKPGYAWRGQPLRKSEVAVVQNEQA